MKHYLLCSFVALTLGLVFLAGCKSTPPEVQALVDEVHAARAPSGDGGSTITEAEGARIEARIPNQGFDWMEAGIAAGQIALAILGVKVLPGSLLRGPWDPKAPPVAG